MVLLVVLAELMGLHDALALKLNAAQFLIEHSQLLLHSIPFSNTISIISIHSSLLSETTLYTVSNRVHSTLTSVPDLTLKLQELLEAILQT